MIGAMQTSGRMAAMRIASAHPLVQRSHLGVLVAAFSTSDRSGHLAAGHGDVTGSSCGHLASDSNETQTDLATNVKKDDLRPGDRTQTHFRATPTKHPLGLGPASSKGKEWSMPHEIWSEEEVNKIQVTHKQPEETVDHLALGGVRALRFSFDLLAGFKTGVVDEHKYLNRIIFLETVAGIPGMVAGALRHLTSLRRMRRDHGWIHTLLEEAENERMHLLTFLKLKQPGPFFRLMVLVSQGVMFNAFFLSYMISPKTCHRFVGYIEEEAVHTYTTLLDDIDANKLPLFSNLPAPAMAKSYWKLPENAMFRDLVLAVRADEANHRVVNHTFADMHKEFKEDAVNPFSIQAKVTEYASAGGIKPPKVADIADGEIGTSDKSVDRKQDAAKGQDAADKRA